MVAFNYRLFHDVRASKWLYISWFALCCLGVQASFSDIVSDARCIANCYTLYAGYNNASEKVCQDATCQECLSPCDHDKRDTPFNETRCLQTCMNSNGCQASCKFLTVLQNFSSILTGDGSTPPTPGIPTVTNKNITSISLEWDPLHNTSGFPVYLIEWGISGDLDRGPHFHGQVFTVPTATIETRILCALTKLKPPRKQFDGLFYKFRIAVLTENSSISYGSRTPKISMPRPAPVSNITITSFEYDNGNPEKEKVKLSASWTSPQEPHFVTNYAMVWDPQKVGKSRRDIITENSQASGSLDIDEKLKKCNHTLTVYSLSQCTPSIPTTITYEYPGCQNITSYPTDLCYEFDPPDSPDKDRKVRNLTFMLKSINDDYTFNMNVTWDHPVYPFRQVDHYIVIWERRGGFFEITSENSYKTSYILPKLRPNEVYDVRVSPLFKGEIGPAGIEETISIPISKPEPDKVAVRNLVFDDFAFSPQTGKFDLNVTWQRPLLNYSQILSYAISYQVNEGAKVQTTTGQTYFNIYGILHGEPVSFNITANYLHPWISGDEYHAKSSAPGPYPAEVTVRSLLVNDFTLDTQTGKYSLNVSWQKPSFNYSQIISYAILYQVNNGKNNAMQTDKTYFNIHGISHGQPVEFSITPQYSNTRIKAVTSQVKTHAPMPSKEEVWVQHLQPASAFVEDKQSNTFAVNFTWKAPSFPYMKVLYYNLSYELSGYPRDQFPCSSLVKGSRCIITGLKGTTFLLSGILPQDHVSVKVTPVYSDKYISGKVRGAEASAPAPREELLKVVGMSHDELVPTSNGLFRTKVSWQKPLFSHSAVRHYSYKITNSTQKSVGKFRRRAIDYNIVYTTKSTNVTIDGIQLGKAIEFKVTPVFVVNMVTGREATITILKTKTPSTDVSSRSMTPGETAGLVIGVLLLVLIVLCLVIWYHREKQKKQEAKGLVSGKHALMIDQWEVDGDLVSLEDELGEGAFGKVYKGALKGLATHCQKLPIKLPMKTTRTSTLKENEMFTVAVKTLHDMADSEQRREFLEEIQLMKTVGSHRNIVNMLGCCTAQEPMFLLVEYLPHGDLLHYLRKHRGKVKEYIGDDSRGPYRSTYCETYLTNGSPTGISVRATKSDRIYVNAPEMKKEKTENIQLLSFNSHNAQDKTGEENKGLDKEEDEKDKNEETLTPGDLMTFAWQISQGMEYLARKGFVHRDLAARNVLVGESKIAKVADFGLTRHVYEEKVYHAKTNRKLPLKWMSIEAIFDQTFTAQSDAWAFGVVLWELVTLGGTPYPSIDNKELLRLLKDGYRMEKPDTCNDELYDMMMDCWNESPEKRPNFTQIRDRLEVMMMKDNPYLDFSALDETREYYHVPSFNSVMEESTDDDLFDDNNQECLQDPNENVKVVSEKPAEESNGIMESLEPVKDKMNSINTANGDQYCKIVGKDLDDMKINFDELQISLCRPTRRGIAF